MRFKLNIFTRIVLIFTLGLFSELTCAEEVEYISPFDSYHRAASAIFVYDRSQYSPYDGPDISHWNLTYSDVNPGSTRVRSGIFAITQSQRVYVDEIWDPMSAHIQLIDVKSSKLIHEFIYPYQFDGALLFNGEGVVYQSLRPEGLCHGRQTKKFVLNQDKLVEVHQPFAYLENTATKLLSNVTLFLAPHTNSTRVAFLNAGTPVSILAIEQGRWFLIKTPLGLTGWIPSYVNEKTNATATLEITQCS